ncbi:MAG: hypothetical protein F6J99_32460 [Moorea sp. SIO4G3]|nr:hypothetical protein [Moorena sp. SIO4G3]
MAHGCAFSLFDSKAPIALLDRCFANSSVAQALALAFRPRYANGHAVRTTL